MIDFLRVTCPSCHVPPGERCVVPTETSQRHVKWPHVARHRAAIELPPEPVRYLTLAEAAEAAGIEYESMRTYRKRSERNRASGDPRPGDLPPEDITLGRTPGWAEQTITDWLASRPRAGARA